MPDQTYEVTLSDGRKFHITADRQPTEEEILAHLPKTEAAPAKLMASHETPAAAPNAETTRENVLGTIGRYGGLLTVPAGPGGEALGRAMAHPDQWPTLAASVAAPLTGGTSLLAPVAAAVGAGGVGSVAKNAAEYFMGQRKAPMDVAKDVARDATVQGATQLAGGAIAKGAGALGRGLYTKALGAPKALRSEFPGLIETGIEEGVIPGTNAGLAKATAARTASAQAARDIVANSPAAQAGVRIPTTTVTRGLDPLRAEVAPRPTAIDAQNAIDAFEQNMVASHPQGFSLQDLVKTTRAAQGEATAAYKAAERAGAAGMDAEANEAVAKRGRGIIEHFAPEVGPQNARTQALIGLQRALKDTTLRPHVLSGTMSTLAGVEEGYRKGDPLAGLETAATMYALTNPLTMGGAGVVLGRTGGGNGVIPANVLRAALLSQMGGDQPPQP